MNRQAFILCSLLLFMFFSSKSLTAKDISKRRDYVVAQKEDTLYYLSHKTYPPPHQTFDSLETIDIHPPEVFYDSLRTRQANGKLTRLFFNWIICSPASNQQYNNINRSDYFRVFEGKIIGSIQFNQLDVFGSCFDDPGRKTRSWIKCTANTLHTTTRKSFVRKSLLFKTGDVFNPFLMTENERIIRAYPFIKDVRFVVAPRSNQPDIVDIDIITKDVFSFGGSIEGSSFEGLELEVYNKNIMGIGHELVSKLVTHNERSPHTGWEFEYNINNIAGNFIDFSVAAGNTFNHERYGLQVNRDFLSPQTKYGGGFITYRFNKAFNKSFDDPINSETPFSYDYTEAWFGKRFPLSKRHQYTTPSLIVTSRVERRNIWNKSTAIEDEHYYSNTTSFWGGVALSKWYHRQNNLVYGFGSTEDIPAGHLAEMVVGYDDDEFIKRWYSHLAFSHGIFLTERNNYLYNSVCFGGFFNSKRFEQGVLELSTAYISRRFFVRQYNVRQFFNLNYMLGIRRFNSEFLALDGKNGIRGFDSTHKKGTQRLSVSSETVFFHNRDFYNFRFASFYYADVAMIGPAGEALQHQRLYAGIGAGLRIRNESLIFRTIQLRFDFYPIRPKEASAVGFSISGELKPRFRSFGGRKPMPVIFR